jgi:3-(3-hydroxy-phenyl)propionate hydroxylase
MNDERILIAGAGPVGLVAAAFLVKAGIPVSMFEAGSDLSTESRASTFHPSTLDLLDPIGVTQKLIGQGLIAPKLQYRTRDGLIAEFDFGDIADICKHPYRVQSEQWRLTRILYEQLRDDPLFHLEFDARVEAVEQDERRVHLTIARGATTERRSGRFLIGADGARSNVRRSLDIKFDGFTWPERFIVISTDFQFEDRMPGLTHVNYVADPTYWHLMLRVPPVWRIMFPVDADLSDEAAVDPAYAQKLLGYVLPHKGAFDVTHTTLYRVHQRVAESFRKGRTFLAGDAAHINNPLGGMGMNGGVHDAINLAERLALVWEGAAPDGELDRYDRQRRAITIETVQNQTIQNKRDLEATDSAAQEAFRARLRTIAADPVATRAYLSRISMVDSLKRAAELG